MTNQYRHLIFDFDGTLVDSAPAILNCLQAALSAHGVPCQTALDVSLIGPPLHETLQRLSGSADRAVLEGLAQSFRQIYDQQVAQLTPLYPGIATTLEALHSGGKTLHIATNKRQRPTQLILNQLGINTYFSTVYAIDMVQPQYPNKSAMLAALLTEQGLAPAQTCYVGDRREDGVAANANHLDFLAATWGYDVWDADLPSHWRLLREPAQLLCMLCSSNGSADVSR